MSSQPGQSRPVPSEVAAAVRTPSNLMVDLVASQAPGSQEVTAVVVCNGQRVVLTFTGSDVVVDVPGQ
jgi:hypothetical protein